MKPADELRAIRRKLALTQKEVADRLGVSTRTVIRWEAGEGIPRTAYLELARSWKMKRGA